MPTDCRLTESGIGDIRIEGKAQLATLGEDDEYTVAVSAGLSLPTGKNAEPAYLGDKNVTGRIKAIGAVDFGKVRAAANLGILLPRDLEQLRHGAGAPAAVRRRRRLRGRPAAST